MTTYRERREARAERLAGWAEGREAKAAAGFARARQMGEAIPFGQPILVGHHSEGRDRNYRARMGRTYDRAFEDAAKAESMASRAANIEDQLSGAIYDDDPDAIERLEERIAALEAQREQRKAENAAFRKEHREALKAMSGYERSQAVPWPSYSVTNLSGNISRNRERLAVVRQRQARQAASEATGVAVETLASGYCSVTFAEKPEREILDALRGAGCSWNKGSWWGKADALPAVVSAQVDG